MMLITRGPVLRGKKCRTGKNLGEPPKKFQHVEIFWLKDRMGVVYLYIRRKGLLRRIALGKREVISLAKKRWSGSFKEVFM